MKENLIYDVGFNNGDDTAYYLHRGFNVLAIEANPGLVARGKQRFESEIAAGRLTVLNVAIAETEGMFSFWVNDDDDGWSSFDKALASRQGTRCHEVTVPGMPLSAILREHGVPYYLKVDIEGHDALCIRALDRNNLPKYVSCELNHSEDIVRDLYQAGYRLFKLLNQTTYTGSIPIFEGEIAWRLLRKAYSRFSPVRYIIHHLPLSLQPKKIPFDDFTSRLNYTFREGYSSGPFGEDTYGPWYSYEAMNKGVEQIRRKYLKAGLSLEDIWCDVHATR